MKSEDLMAGSYRPSSYIGSYVPAPVTKLQVNKQRSFSTMRSPLPEEFGLDDHKIREGRGLKSRMETPGARVLGYNKAFHQEVNNLNQTVDIKGLIHKNNQPGIFKKYMPGVMTAELRSEFDKLNVPVGIHPEPFKLDPLQTKRNNPAK